MLDRFNECASGRRSQRLAHSAHERRGDRRPLAPRDPLRGAASTKFAFQNLDEHNAMFHAPRVRREACVIGEIGAPKHLSAQQLKMPIGPGADRKRTVTRVEELIRHN